MRALQIPVPRPGDARPYQEERIDEGYRRLSRGEACAIVLPTGTGKTYTALRIVDRVLSAPWAKARSVLWWVDCVALRDQTIEAAARYGLPLDVRTIQSRAKVREEDFDLIILDEAHKFLTPARVKKIQAAKTRLLGLTATPRTGDGRHIESLLGNDYVCGPYTLGQAIEDGWLCDAAVRGVDLVDVDLGGVRAGRDDFNQDDLARVMNVPAHNREIVRRWLEAARRPDGSLMVSSLFGVDCAHADALALEANRQLAAQGAQERIVAIHSKLDAPKRGDLPRGEAADLLRRFKAGEFAGVASVAMVAEGFDHPPLQCGVLARPTKSDRLLVQMLGRVLRLHPSKDSALFLDATQSFDRLDLATIYDAIEPRPKEERGPATEPRPRQAREVKLSDVVSRVREIDVFRRAGTARKMPWTWTGDRWALSLGERATLVVARARRNPSRCAAAVLCYDGHTAVFETVFQAEHPEVAIQSAEEWVELRGLQVCPAVPGAVEKAVTAWFRDRAAPTEGTARKLREHGLPVPAQQGEAMAEVRRLIASGTYVHGSAGGSETPGQSGEVRC